MCGVVVATTIPSCITLANGLIRLGALVISTSCGLGGVVERYGEQKDGRLHCSSGGLVLRDMEGAESTAIDVIVLWGVGRILQV